MSEMKQSLNTQRLAIHQMLPARAPSSERFQGVAYTVEREEYYPDDDSWLIPSVGRNFKFEFSSKTTDVFVYQLKRTTKALLETQNSRSVYAYFSRIKSLIDLIDPNITTNEIDAENVAEWVMRGNYAYVPHIRAFFNASRDIRACVATAEAYEFVDNFKTARNDNNDPVRTWNPVRGPYRPAEDEALKTALDDAFNVEEISLRDYLIIRLFRGTGMRPQQLAWMKVGDIRTSERGTEIRIPQAKQHGVLARGKMLPWKRISAGLANLLTLYIETELTPKLTNLSLLELTPLFVRKRTVSINPQRNVDNHATPDNLKSAYKAVFDKLCVISPLTGEVINTTPVRERHTYLTMLALSGCSAAEIALNAGHKSTQSCVAYVDASIEHFQRMEKLVGEAFIPIADRFLGKISRSSSDKSKTSLFDPEMNQVGSCTSGGCSAIDTGLAPFACYTCRRFNAWAEAPHQEILDFLITQQQDLLEANHSQVAETKTQTIIAIYDLLEAIRLKYPDGVK